MVRTATSCWRCGSKGRGELGRCCAVPCLDERSKLLHGNPKGGSILQPTASSSTECAQYPSPYCGPPLWAASAWPEVLASICNYGTAGVLSL